MKKALLNLVITLAVLAIFLRVVTLPYSNQTKFLYFSPCDNPIHYKIDAVDPKFGLSKEEFTKDVALAASAWDRTIDKNLFTQDPKGKLSVNLIYDERQTLNKQIINLQSQIENQQSSLKPSLADYEKQVADFKQKLANLNAQIDYWNSKGGAPKDEYDKLTAQQSDLKTEADRLNKMAQSLNQSAQQFNTNVGKLNQTIDTFNEELAARPEEGIYDPNGNKIEIYFNLSKNELVHTITHELGHSLGLEHLKNKKAIMYSYTNGSIVPTLDDIQTLKTHCANKSYFDLYKQKWQLIINQLQQNFAQIS